MGSVKGINPNHNTSEEKLAIWHAIDELRALTSEQTIVINNIANKAAKDFWSVQVWALLNGYTHLGKLLSDEEDLLEYVKYKKELAEKDLKASKEWIEHDKKAMAELKAATFKTNYDLMIKKSELEAEKEQLTIDYANDFLKNLEEVGTDHYYFLRGLSPAGAATVDPRIAQRFKEIVDANKEESQKKEK